MAELVDQTTLRITGGMVGMESACRRSQVHGLMRPMRPMRPMRMTLVDRTLRQAINWGLRRCHCSHGARRAVRHSVVQAQALRQQQGKAQRPSAARGQRKLDHRLSVADLSSAAALVAAQWLTQAAL